MKLLNQNRTNSNNYNKDIAKNKIDCNNKEILQRISQIKIAI